MRAFFAVLVMRLRRRPDTDTSISEGDWSAAEGNYKNALAQEPRNASLLCNYGAFLQDARQDMSGAERMFRNAILAQPSHVGSNALGRGRVSSAGTG